MEMVDNFLINSIYLIFGYHAVYIYAGALIQIAKNYKKKKDENKAKEGELIIKQNEWNQELGRVLDGVKELFDEEQS